MGSKAEHLVTLIVVSGGDGGYLRGAHQQQEWSLIKAGEELNLIVRGS